MFISSSIRRTVCVVAAGLLVGISLLSPVSSVAEETRRVKTRVQPVYPQIARTAKITGTVKIEAIVAANGEVRDAKILGGHPLLGAAAVDAVKKWKYEPASEQSTVVLEFNFSNAM